MRTLSPRGPRQDAAFLSALRVLGAACGNAQVSSAPGRAEHQQQGVIPCTPTSQSALAPDQLIHSTPLPAGYTGRTLAAPDLPNQNLHFNRFPRGFLCAQEVESTFVLFHLSMDLSSQSKYAEYKFIKEQPWCVLTNPLYPVYCFSDLVISTLVGLVPHY